MPSSKHDMAMAIMNSIAAMVPATKSAPNWPSQQSAMGVREVHRDLCPIAELIIRQIPTVIHKTVK